jgi:Beta-lactamase
MVGAGVALLQGNEIVYNRGFGARDLQLDAPVTPRTRFRIAFNTKSMTSMLLAHFVDSGAVRWNTRAVGLWLEFRAPDRRVDGTSAHRRPAGHGRWCGGARDGRVLPQWGRPISGRPVAVDSVLAGDRASEHRLRLQQHPRRRRPSLSCCSPAARSPPTWRRHTPRKCSSTSSSRSGWRTPRWPQTRAAEESRPGEAPNRSPSRSGREAARPRTSRRAMERDAQLGAGEAGRARARAARPRTAIANQQT